jgi:hypothetical protein
LGKSNLGQWFSGQASATEACVSTSFGRSSFALDLPAVALGADRFEHMQFRPRQFGPKLLFHATPCIFQLTAEMAEGDQLGSNQFGPKVLRTGVCRIAAFVPTSSGRGSLGCRYLSMLAATLQGRRSVERRYAAKGFCTTEQFFAPTSSGRDSLGSGQSKLKVSATQGLSRQQLRAQGVWAAGAFLGATLKGTQHRRCV